MPNTSLLVVAYLANIVILVPVCFTLVFGGGTESIFENKVADSEGLRLLVASLYTAIPLASIAGLFAPLFFAPLLLIQIIYKSLWLFLFVWPQYRTLGTEAVPWGITKVFIAIIVTYPFLLWFGTRST